MRLGNTVRIELTIALTVCEVVGRVLTAGQVILVTIYTRVMNDF